MEFFQHSYQQIVTQGLFNMKAVVYYDEETIKCEEYPKPDIQDGEILVKMKVCQASDILHI